MIFYETDVIDPTKPCYIKRTGLVDVRVDSFENGTANVWDTANKRFVGPIYPNTGCVYPVFTSFCTSRAKHYFTNQFYILTNKKPI